ncbi:MAG: glycosyltransferase family A protein [Verrucomicrobiota bacterium]|nr:glycosyltransferase family A protein [Verrucomicrobiota bacterium]
MSRKVFVTNKVLYPMVRNAWAAYWKNKLKLKTEHEKHSVIPFVRIKNEDYWLEPGLRALSKVFKKIVVLENGSTDKTNEIIKNLQHEGLPIVAYHYKDRYRNDNLVRNLVLDHEFNADWFFMADGDELY